MVVFPYIGTHWTKCDDLFGYSFMPKFTTDYRPNILISELCFICFLFRTTWNPTRNYYLLVAQLTRASELVEREASWTRLTRLGENKKEKVEWWRRRQKRERRDRREGIKKQKKEVCGATGSNLQVTSDKTTPFRCLCSYYIHMHKNSTVQTTSFYWSYMLLLKPPVLMLFWTIPIFYFAYNVHTLPCA